MLKAKFRISSLALVAMLICSSNAYSQFIALGSNGAQTIGIGPNESFVIFGASVGGAAPFMPIDVDALDLFVDNTGPANIVNISGLGVFSGASTTFTPASISASSAAEASLLLPVVSAIPTSSSPIAEIFFDTSGLSIGDSVSFVLGGNAPNTIFTNAGATITTNFQASFTADVVGVPEPSSAVIPVSYTHLTLPTILLV